MPDIVLEMIPLDTVFGGWCDDCALPSLATVSVAVVYQRSLNRAMPNIVTAVCTECGATITTGPGDQPRSLPTRPRDS